MIIRAYMLSRKYYFIGRYRLEAIITVIASQEQRNNMLSGKNVYEET